MLEPLKYSHSLWNSFPSFPLSPLFSLPNSAGSVCSLYGIFRLQFPGVSAASPEAQNIYSSTHVFLVNGKRIFPTPNGLSSVICFMAPLDVWETDVARIFLFYGFCCFDSFDFMATLIMCVLFLHLWHFANIPFLYHCYHNCLPQIVIHQMLSSRVPSLHPPEKPPRGAGASKQGYTKCSCVRQSIN